MREEHRYPHVFQRLPGGAAQDEFPDPRMPIAAHDQEIGAGIENLGQECDAGLLAVAGDRFGNRVDPMACQDRSEFASGDRRRAAFIALRIDPDDADLLARRNKGKLSKTARAASRRPFQATMAVPKRSTGFAFKGRTSTGSPDTHHDAIDEVEFDPLTAGAVDLAQENEIAAPGHAR